MNAVFAQNIQVYCRRAGMPAMPEKSLGRLEGLAKEAGLDLGWRKTAIICFLYAWMREKKLIGNPDALWALAMRTGHDAYCHWYEEEFPLPRHIREGGTPLAALILKMDKARRADKQG